MANDDKNVNMRPQDMDAFFDENANSGFKFKDLVFLVARNLPWFSGGEYSQRRRILFWLKR